jgi:hypothetical protein
VKRWASILSIAAVVVGVTALSATAVTRKATTRNVTFHLVEKDVGFNLVDNPPRQGFNEPPLMGDQFAIAAEMQTRVGAHAGWLDATCMISRGGPHGHGPCYGVYSFKGGQIAGITTFNLAGNVTRIILVGGTGAYAGVRGTVVSVSRGQNSPYSDDTFNLILP